MKNFNEMTREELLEFTEREIKTVISIVEHCSTFEGWASLYYTNGFNVISNGVNTSTCDIVLNKAEKSNPNRYIIGTFLKRKYDLYNSLLKQSLVWEEMAENPDDGAIEYLEELYDEALDIFYKCGFRGITKTEAILDVSPSNKDYAYYSSSTKNIMIRENMLIFLDKEEVLGIILHEIIHAFVDKFFDTKELRAFSDDSIIFSAFITRLNRKLKALGYNIKVTQNDNREADAKAKFKSEISTIADCRKSLLTVIDEAMEMIESLKNDYGTIEVLGA